MRGDDEICGRLFSYIDLEKRVRSDHPLRLIRQIVKAALKALSGEFDKLYSLIGRESIPPERLMRALLLQAFYSIRSERQLVERIDYDLLFRWFVPLGIENPAWDATTFTKNRDLHWRAIWRTSFLQRCCCKTRSEVCSRTSTSRSTARCLEAWASLKSFRPKEGLGRTSDPGRNGARLSRRAAKQ